MGNPEPKPPFLRGSMYKFIKDPNDVRLGEVIKRAWTSGDVGILGVPWDGAVGTRPGSRLAPSRIRSILYTMPLTSGKVSLVDLGDVDVVIGNHDETWRRIELTVQESLKMVRELLIIGGDSTVSYASFRGLRGSLNGDLAFILLDAHPDVRIISEGLTSGQVIRWIRGIDPEAYVCVIGVRPFSNAPYLLDEARRLNVKVYTMDYLDSHGIDKVINEVLSEVEGRVTYLSVNLDVVDPAFAPGVNSPSPGGFTSREVIRLVSLLSHSLKPRIFDVVEVTPPFDLNDVTSMLAAVILINAVWVNQ